MDRTRGCGLRVCGSPSNVGRSVAATNYIAATGINIFGIYKKEGMKLFKKKSELPAHTLSRRYSLDRSIDHVQRRDSVSRGARVY